VSSYSNALSGKSGNDTRPTSDVQHVFPLSKLGQSDKIRRPFGEDCRH
jgi:hypothetical protein